MKEKAVYMGCFRKTEGCSQLQEPAHIPVDAFKSFAGLEDMRLLNLLKTLATGFGRADFSTVGCKGKGFDEGI